MIRVVTYIDTASHMEEKNGGKLPEAAMKLIGYGEDSLSLWAIMHNLSSILQQLNDDTPVADVIVFYRPSFGRRGNPPCKPDKIADSAQFGEFDAIIGSPKGTYLVETKWSNSPEIRDSQIQIHNRQVFRHEVMREYFDVWRKNKPLNWAAFSDLVGEALHGRNWIMPIAPKHSQLASNLEKVLSLLENSGPVANVLLYCHLGPNHATSLSAPENFHLISLPCQSNDGFITLLDEMATENHIDPRVAH